LLPSSTLTLRPACVVLRHMKPERVNVSLLPQILADLDFIAAEDARDAGATAPNRSATVAGLVTAERKRREKRAATKSTDA